MEGFEGDVARLRADLDGGPLADKTDQILDLIRPCLWISRERVPDVDLPIGASKFGGAPDLPETFEWPEFEGSPLAFLAQIDLAQIASFDLGGELPSEGLLTFFFDTERQPWGDAAERDGWAVAWFPANTNLHQRLPTSDPLPLCSLAFTKRASLPGHDSPFVGDLDLTDAERDAYFDPLGTLSAPPPEHRFLGYCNAIQNDVPLNIEIDANGPIADWRSPEGARRIEDSKAWRPLLQLDSDDGVGTCWGDAGMLYFCLRESDLREQAFERTRMALQCY